MTDPHLLAENAQLKAENAQLRSGLDDIERMLRRNSTNSSAPPSSDGPKVQRPKKPATGKKRGGQPGQRGTTRMLLPVGEVDDLVEVVIEGGCSCGCSDVRLRSPQRHQVFELRDPSSPSIGCSAAGAEAAIVVDEHGGPQVFRRAAWARACRRWSQRSRVRFMSVVVMPSGSSRRTSA